jgi:flagellar biosynthetic protein FlhB
MAEGSDLEKTEQPSQRRLEKAREEGQVPRSRELSGFALLMAAGAGLWLTGNSVAGRLAAIMKDGLTLDAAVMTDPQFLLTRLAAQSIDILFALAPLLGVLLLAALTAPMLLSGWMFSWEGVLPDFSRLSPMSGISRIFSSHGLVELAKAIVKVVLVGSVAAWVIWHHKDAVFALTREPLEPALAHGTRLVAMSLFAVAGSMLLIVAADVPFQIWEYHHKLKMSREELRQEARESEGDPHVKAAVRSAQREMARKRMMQEIPKADVVVTNPTHYAVALKYASGEMRAPRVVAKGADLVAARIRELATEHHVPVMEAPPLARALFRHTEIGEEVPEKLYTVVAQVLAYVFQLRRYQTYGGAAPQLPHELAVPAELDPQQAPA